MKIEEMRRVLIVGAGTMGQQIGLQCAMHGYQVILYDIEPRALVAAQPHVENFADQLVGAGRLTSEGAKEALARIAMTGDPQEAAADADLISESVVEDPKVKGQVFAQFNRLCPPRTIFTTNASTLLPSMFAQETGRPAQFAAMHFHPPVWDANIVDIMPHPGTDPSVVALLGEFARSIGEIPIVEKKESSSYVFNSMLNAVMGAAMTLVANGVASIEDVDRAWMGVTKMPIGPFGIMDMIGIDTLWHAATFWATQSPSDPQPKRYASFLKGYMDKGCLGVKTGRGFYTYPNPAYQRAGVFSIKPL